MYIIKALPISLLPVFYSPNSEDKQVASLYDTYRTHHNEPCVYFSIHTPHTYTLLPPHTQHNHHPLTHSPYHKQHTHHPHTTTLTTPSHTHHITHSLTHHTPSHNTLSHTQAILNPLQGFFNAIAYGGICQTFCSWLCTKLKRKDPYVSSWSGEYIDVDFRVSRGRIHCSRRKIST